MHATETVKAAKDQLGAVKDFRRWVRGSTMPLPEHESRKVTDLCDDVANYEPRLDAPTCIGSAFTIFERVAGRPMPYWLEHPLLWMRRPFSRRRRTARKAPDCHDVPTEGDANPHAFARDFRLFDGLSLIYGGKFRGSVVINYTLAVIASGTLIFSLTIGHSPPPFISDLLDVLRDLRERLPFEWARHVADQWPVSASIELVCLTVIGIIYTTGATPEVDEYRCSYAPRWVWQRWHQRWLEYRLLAERFRYVDLLLPLGKHEAEAVAIAPVGEASSMWHQRYFEWRIGHAAAAKWTVLQYRDNALAVMIAQERYHASNSHKRGAIAERLHVLASCLFVAGIVVCLAEMFIEFGAEELQPRACIAPNHMRDAVIFFAALFPIVSAAIHGILATTEYTKVADNSGETAEAIHGLVERLKKIPAGMEPANPTSLEPMRDTVLEFATLAINEATGWRAMLRDKNVPLA